MKFFLTLAFAGIVYSQGTLSEYTTYIGDSNTCHVARIGADASGNTFVAGNRSSGSLTEMFVVKLDTNGKLTSFFSFGGNGADTVNDMVLDPMGNVILAGATTSTVFPLFQPMQSTPGPGFVAKLDGRTNQILFATYFPAAVNAIAADAGGNVYLTGSTMSPTFPVTPGLPSGAAGGSVPQISAAFLTKISAAGDRILYSMRLSGQNKPCGCCSSCFLSARYATGVAVAVDPSGNAFMAGDTDTTDLPVTAGAFLQNGIGAFVAKVNAAGTALSYLTYIGAANYVLSPNNSPGNSAGAIAVDSTGFAYLAGATSDPNFPATPGAYQTVFGSPAPNQPYPPPPSDAFVLKLKPDGSGVSWATYLGGTGVDAAKSIALDGAGNVWIAGTTASPGFPNAQGWSQGGDFLAEVNASGLTLPYAARYPTGTVAQSLAIDATGLLHAAGAAGMISAIAPTAKPLPRIIGIANAAYGAVGAQIARGELISIYGPHIGPVSPVSNTSTGSLPDTLGGVQVMMGSIPLSLLYVSDSQINAVAPISVYGPLQVSNNGVATPLFPFSPIDADPEIFRNPDGSAAAVNQDGTLNSADHPAAAGSIVTIWITGTGTSGCCTVYAGFTQAPANTVSIVPEPAAGIVQISFQLPADAPYVVVGAGGQMSHPASIYVGN